MIFNLRNLMIEIMRSQITFFTLFLTITLHVYSKNVRTTINLTVKELTTDSQSNLHLISASKSLDNSILRLNSVDSWVLFNNIIPAIVIDLLLKYIYTNNPSTILSTNFRTSIYKSGTVVLYQYISCQQFRVYLNQNIS